MNELTELEILRHFDAPRDRVFAAFTEPGLLAAWFGSVGWSVPQGSISIDASNGGHQKFTMVNDDDPTMTSPVDARFTEVVDDELLVGYESVLEFPGLEDGAKLTLQLEFADEDGGTLLTLHQGPFPAEMRDMSEEGWKSSFTKLDALLARSS